MYSNKKKTYSNYKSKKPARKYSGKNSTKKKTYPRKQNAITKYSTHAAINPKLKTMDQDFGAYANPYVVDALPAGALTISSTAAVQNIVMIQQGGGESQRIGNKAALKSLRIRFQLIPTGNANFTTINYARFMVIYDRQVNGVYPAANTILSQLNQSNVTVAGTYLDSINPNFLERFVVLCDEYLTFQPASTVAANIDGPSTDKAFYMDKYIKLRNLEVQFGGNVLTGAGGLGVANVTTGALYLLSWGNVAAGAEPYCWTGNTRLRFHDC